jgi:hypothetical protein
VIVGLTIMGFDFVADITYRVTSWGCDAHYGSSTYPGHPAEPPSFEIDRIRLYRDVPLTAEEHRRKVIKTPIFEATGALFDVLSELPDIKDAIPMDALEHADTPDHDEY